MAFFTQCWNEYAFLQDQKDVFPTYYKKPGVIFGQGDWVKSTETGGETPYVRMAEESYTCDEMIALNDIKVVNHDPINKSDTTDTAKQNATKIQTDSGPKVEQPQYTFTHDGDYLLVIHMEGSAKVSFQAMVDVKLEGPHGYLSVVDWPLLPFYGVMCGVYVCMGIGWLVVCALHFRDLLRIQFWIGGVIFLGMLEKAMFYAEFQNINSTGVSAKGLIFTAELVSCGKRTLARMLVIIVSLGFGIVKPRLGPTLHRVVGVGGLYFALATTEAYLRVTKPKNDVSTSTMLAGIPLAVIDSAICWWVFSGLTQTLRTLRLRRNLVKFSLYRHFTNVIIFNVVASIIFMLINIKLFKMAPCLTEWRELWVDEAFWHLLFSILLACIMVLWTPSNNNKRYAFQPLLDNDGKTFFSLHALQFPAILIFFKNHFCHLQFPAILIFDFKENNIFTDFSFPQF